MKTINELVDTINLDSDNLMNVTKQSHEEDYAEIFFDGIDDLSMRHLYGFCIKQDWSLTMDVVEDKILATLRKI